MTLQAADIVIRGGFKVIFYTQLDDDGYAVGGNGVVPAGDINGSPALRLDGARTVDVSSPDREIQTAVGDDRPMVSFTFPATELPNGVLEVMARDHAAMGYFQNVPTREYGTQEEVARAVDTVLPQVGWIFQGRAKSWKSPYRGTKLWAGQYVFSSEVAPLGEPNTQRETLVPRYAINCSNAGRHLHGETFSIGNDGASQIPIKDFASENPMHLHVFRGNAVRTTFNVEYTPVDPDTGGMYITVAGEAQTYGALEDYTVTDRTITFTGAPANNALIEVLYEFEESELS